MIDIWDSTIEGGRWNLLFSKHFNNQELDTVERFLSRIQQKRVSHDLEDRMI